MKNVLLAGGIAALLPLTTLAETEASSEPIFTPEAQEAPKTFIQIEQIVPNVLRFVFTVERADGTKERIEMAGIEGLNNPFSSYIETTYPSEYTKGESIDYSSVRTGMFLDFRFDAKAGFLRYNIEDSNLTEMKPYEVEEGIMLEMPKISQQTIRSGVNFGIEDRKTGVLFEGTGEGKTITKVSYAISEI